MKLTLLEASAGMPTHARNMTSIILNLQQPTRVGMWLFDCGEGIQHQFPHTPYHPGKLSKIFITHLHDDYLFGLPGLLCSRPMQGNFLPLALYGPKGLRESIETTLRLSGSRTDYPLTIIEVSPGLVFDEEGYRITTYPLSHLVECYGYRIEQHDKPGAFDAAQLTADGVPPGPLFHQPKYRQCVTLEDGRVTGGSRYLRPATPSKTLVILGDTAPCSQAPEMVHGADVVAHGTTLEQAMAEEANSRDRSSSQQTAAFAKEAGIDTLIITHFNSRYDAKGCLGMLTECRGIFANTLSAENFMVYKMV